MAEFKIYIRTCNEERDIMFNQVRSLETNVTKLQTQSLGKNKNFDVAIKILMLIIASGGVISGIIFWIIRLTGD